MLRLARWLLFAAVQPFGLMLPSKCWDGSTPPNANLDLCPVQPAQDVSGLYQDQSGGGGVDGPHSAPTLQQAVAKSEAKPQEPMKQLKNAVQKTPAGIGWLVLLAVAVAVAGKH